jgi:hypothetical protein
MSPIEGVQNRYSELFGYNVLYWSKNRLDVQLCILVKINLIEWRPFLILKYICNEYIYLVNENYYVALNLRILVTQLVFYFNSGRSNGV